MGDEDDDKAAEAIYGGWITPAAAVARALPTFGKETLTITALGNRLRDGLLPAMAKDIVFEEDGQAAERLFYRPVPSSHWAVLSGGFLGSDVWKTGHFELRLEHGTERHSLHGVRFDPGALDEYLASFGAPQPPPTPVMVKIEPPVALPSPPPQRVVVVAPAAAKHAGGKPPKEIWERVWVNIAARLINGDFDPKRQKDVEDAIKDEAHNLGDDVGDATARKHAKYLWDNVKKVHN